MTIVTEELTKPLYRASRSYLDHKFPQESIDINGNGKAEVNVPRGPLLFYGKNLFMPLLVIFGGQFVWALLFVAIEDWSYRDAWYHCITTVTTVGYGDVTVRAARGGCSSAAAGARLLPSPRPTASRDRSRRVLAR